MLLYAGTAAVTFIADAKTAAPEKRGKALGDSHVYAKNFIKHCPDCHHLFSASRTDQLEKVSLPCKDLFATPWRKMFAWGGDTGSVPGSLAGQTF